MSESVEGQAAPPRPDAPDGSERYESLLASGERVLLVRRRHWITFVQAARWFAIVLLLGILAGASSTQLGSGGVSGFFHTIFAWGFGLFVLVGLAGVGWFFLEWQRERYLVTTRRFIEAGGIINKWSRDTSLSMITDMLVSHPWIGRILGYGEVELLTASEAGTNKIQFLPPSGREFKKSCSTPSISSRSASAAGTPPAMPPRPPHASRSGAPFARRRRRVDHPARRHAATAV